MLNLTNSEFQFSYYKNLVSSKEAQDELNINELIEIIRYGYLKDTIGKLRAIQNKEDCRNIKLYEIPAVTLSGLFKKRNSKGLLNHSGLMQIDIDQVSDYNTLFKKIIRDEHTYVAFRSPRGKGIKVIVKVNPSEQTHLEQFYALERYYNEEFDIQIDASCKDLARCMLLSYDPDIFCNPFSSVFAECFMPKREVEQTIPNFTQINFSSQNEETIIEEIVTEIENKRIDITDGYENWIRIGYALSSVMGEAGRTFYHRISQFHPEYSTHKCDNQFTSLNERNNGAIGLGTLIYYAGKHHINNKFSGTVPTADKTFKKIKQKPVQSNGEDETLFDLLKQKRYKLAVKENLPAYMIFADSTLQEMCDKLPENQDQFEELKGVGSVKVEKYAMHFLPLIRKYKGVEGPLKLKFGQKFKEQKSFINQFTEKEKQLFENLRTIRSNISREEGMKPYWIFGNSTLSDIVKLKPKEKDQLLGFKGIGQTKVDWFGDEIIYEIEKIFG